MTVFCTSAYRGALVLLLSCGTAGLCSGTANATVLAVTLAPEAQVEARIFTLGEVARVESDSPQASQALRRLAVGTLDRSGNRLLLTREQLARLVRREWPHGAQRVDWHGADAVTVRMHTVQVDPQTLIDIAVNALRSRLEREFSDVELGVASRPGALRVPPVDIDFKARLVDAAAPQRRMRVDVELRSGERLLHSVTLRFDVRAHAAGWLLRRDVDRGQVLGEADVERGRVDAARLGLVSAAAAADSPLGLRTQRGLRAGTPLAARLLEVPPMVARDDDVAVELRSGDVLIESRGIALADGRPGTLLPVRLPGPRLLRARVIGPKRVTL
jgi:flagellar basal body P-ring formation protein FlgA